MWPFVLILAVPLIEIGLFVTLGGAIGLWGTLAFVLGSAVLGMAVLRQSGLTRPVAGRGLMVQIAGQSMTMLAGVFLILPGFLTSALGGLLLLPPVQAAVVWALRHRLGAGRFGGMDGDSPSAPGVIDAEYEIVPPRQAQQRPPSRWTQH